jgi:hypothetical protein
MGGNDWGEGLGCAMYFLLGFGVIAGLVVALFLWLISKAL